MDSEIILNPPIPVVIDEAKKNVGRGRGWALLGHEAALGAP
jgi:hypothetical protein